MAPQSLGVKQFSAKISTVYRKTPEFWGYTIFCKEY